MRREGDNAGEKVKGRKIHALFNTEGLRLPAFIVARRSVLHGTNARPCSLYQLLFQPHPPPRGKPSLPSTSDCTTMPLFGRLNHTARAAASAFGSGSE